MEKEFLQTSELIAATNLGRETLRFYENKGLIPSVPRTDAGYRLYPKHVVEIISFIKEAQEAGFTLKEIKELIDLQNTTQATCGVVSPILSTKLSELEIEINVLKKKHSILKKMSFNCEKQIEATPCSIFPVLSNSTCCS